MGIFLLIFCRSGPWKIEKENWLKIEKRCSCLIEKRYQTFQNSIKYFFVNFEKYWLSKSKILLVAFLIDYMSSNCNIDSYLKLIDITWNNNFLYWNVWNILFFKIGSHFLLVVTGSACFELKLMPWSTPILYLCNFWLVISLENYISDSIHPTWSIG